MFQTGFVGGYLTFLTSSAGFGFQELSVRVQEQAGAHSQIPPAMGFSRMNGQVYPHRNIKWTFFIFNQDVLVVFAKTVVNALGDQREDSPRLEDQSAQIPGSWTLEEI